MSVEEDDGVFQAIRAGAYPVYRRDDLAAACSSFRTAYYLSDEPGRELLVALYPDEPVPA